MRRIIANIFALFLCCSLASAGQLSLLGAGGPPAAAGASNTFNPADKGLNLTLSGGNLVVTQTTANFNAVRSTNGHASGKFYAEVVVTGGGDPGNNVTGIGVADSSAGLNNFVGADAHGLNTYGTGQTYYNGSNATYTGMPAYTTGNTVGIADDITGGKICLTIDGTNWNAVSGNTTCPTTGTGAYTPTFSGGTLYVAVTENAALGPNVVLTLKNSSFTFGLPLGYSAW